MSYKLIFKIGDIIRFNEIDKKRHKKEHQIQQKQNTKIFKRQS